MSGAVCSSGDDGSFFGARNFTLLRRADSAEWGEGEVVVFGDADVAGGDVVDPAGDGEVAEGEGRGDRGVGAEVLDLEEDVLLGEDVDEWAFVMRLAGLSGVWDLVLVE